MIFFLEKQLWNVTFDHLSSQNSPKQFCPKDRVFDIDAIYNVIDDAQQFVYIAVMDYLPIVIDTNAKRLVRVQIQFPHIAEMTLNNHWWIKLVGLLITPSGLIS